MNIIAIDLKSFYASVECQERNLDPLTTNLVVADASRTEKTICLAVSPSLKSYGIPGRARLFEVVSRVRQVNRERQRRAPGRKLVGESSDYTYLQAHPEVAVGFEIAPPQMSHYMKVSTQIYDIYTQFIAPEDIHVYSIDEVFMDVTHYTHLYKEEAAAAGMDVVHYMALKIIREVLAATGITATAGIGTNLYLAKVAMDVVAKHVEADSDGVRIAALDEAEYRKVMWTHRPLTDFWRVGKGIARKLEAEGLMTMGDVALCSAGKKTDYYNEELLYKLFGVNAERISVGQVLTGPYTVEMARVIVKEMTDGLILDLVRKKLVTDQMVLTVGYDIENLARREIRSKYNGPITTDFYGREVPKQAHGSINLGGFTSSTRRITAAVMELYDRIMNPDLLVRRMYVVCNHVKDEAEAAAEAQPVQLDMFTDYDALEKKQEAEKAERERERRQQEVVLAIKDKWGKNAILRGMNFTEGATARERNQQVGGHNA